MSKWTEDKKAVVHQLHRNRIYAGEFDRFRKMYGGIHTPLLRIELWPRIQALIDRRFAGRHTKTRREFAFSGLITYRHCGCLHVGELKKGRDVYEHSARLQNQRAAGEYPDGSFENWLPLVNQVRTSCLSAAPRMALLFEEVNRLPV